MEEYKIMKLVLEVSKSDEEINRFNKEIDNLTQELRENTGEEENENLKLLLQINNSDILEYKKIEILKSEFALNAEILENLKKRK